MKEIVNNPYVIGVEYPRGKDINPTHVIMVFNNMPSEELTKLHLKCMDEFEHYEIKMLKQL